jgi:choice-of-anchor B domain-containing protein
MRRIGYGVLAIIVAGAMGTVPLVAQSMAGGTQSMNAAPAYGGAVAISDGDVFVGEAGNLIGPGAVYVYRKGADGWSEVARLVASDGFAGDGFGAAIATNGGSMLVGTQPHAQVGGAAAVYVFERTAPGSWAQVGRLPTIDVDDTAGYGESLALGDGVAFVGAPGLGGSTGEGSVYVFGGSGDSWTGRGQLAAGAAGSGFGASLAIGSGRLLVGAPAANIVYSFAMDGGTWQQQGTLASQRVEGDDGFGASVSIEGDLAIVSAPGHNQSEGAVFAFQAGANGEWDAAGQLVAFDGFQRDGFGSAIALAGGDLWVGSPRASNRNGAAYVFSAGAEGWAGAEKVSDNDPEVGDAFASALAASGDVAVVGVVGADLGAGTATIFERGAQGWQAADVVVSEMEQYSAVLGGQVDCADGEATAFACSDYDLVSFLPVADMGVPRGVNVNDIWGWADPDTGREYALVGRKDGTSFVDVTDPLQPRYLGQLWRTEGSPLASWRDIKVYKNHAYIVADGSGRHGIQIFDLTQLRDVTDPVTFEETARYDGVASVHNIAINEETGIGYSVGNSSGGETCGGGIHIIDLKEPASPEFLGCFSQPGSGRNGTGYTHDAQCVTYHGPDEEHDGKQICFGSNETAFSIADVTDPANTEALAFATYPDVAYTHQGWLSEDHAYFFQGDELDEGDGRKTRTLVWDITDLDDPQLAKEFFGTHESTDHNMYVLGNLLYQSNNRAGMRVLDISDPENPTEVGFFDTVPHGDNGSGTGGSWSNYPYFPSGNIIVSSRFEGLFILKKRQPIM